MIYVPDRGDVIWLNFNPQAGHEQAGKRPAFVVSPAAYNKKVGLGLFCPITNKIKGYPFEVNLPSNISVTGTILTDQVKSLDWQIRKATFIGKLPPEVTNLAIEKLMQLIK